MTHEYNDLLPLHRGKIPETGDTGLFQANGYWIGTRGRHITSYIRVDTYETNAAGDPVTRQYSRNRHNEFFIETEDTRYM